MLPFKPIHLKKTSLILKCNILGILGLIVLTHTYTHTRHTYMCLIPTQICIYIYRKHTHRHTYICEYTGKHMHVSNVHTYTCRHFSNTRTCVCVYVCVFLMHIEVTNSYETSKSTLCTPAHLEHPHAMHATVWETHFFLRLQLCP